MSLVPSDYNKFSALIDRDINATHSSSSSSWQQLLFGSNIKQRSKSLVTVDGSMWTGRLYVGSESTPMDVIFDNASDWLTI